MKHEKVLLCEGGTGECRCRVDRLVVPDIRFHGLFVSTAEAKVLNYAYESAVYIRVLILEREKQSSHQKMFTIDIPDPWFIANAQNPPLRKELREEIMLFHMTFHALVRHFLPKAKQVGYSFDGKTRHGVRYKGCAWVSNDR